MTRMMVSAVIILLIATIDANLIDRGKFWTVTSEKLLLGAHPSFIRLSKGSLISPNENWGKSKGCKDLMGDLQMQYHKGLVLAGRSGCNCYDM